MREQPSPAWLLVVELAALLLGALAPLFWELPVPVVVPLIAVASLSMSVRRASLASEPGPGGAEQILIGAGSGLIALALAVLVATPLFSGGGVVVQWTMFPTVRGSGGQLVTLAVLLVALSVAQEVVFRRWILERAYQLGASGSGSILIAAGLEALVGPGPLLSRFGMLLFGCALGMLFWRSGRRLGPSLAARLAFSVGALVLQWLQWVE